MNKVSTLWLSMELWILTASAQYHLFLYKQKLNRISEELKVKPSKS